MVEKFKNLGRKPYSSIKVLFGVSRTCMTEIKLYLCTGQAGMQYVPKMVT